MDGRDRGAGISLLAFPQRCGRAHSFDLPADAPRSTPEKKRNRIAWILEVSAETEGLDYQSYFEIPVFEPEASGFTPDSGASPAPSTESTSSDRSAASDEQDSPQRPAAPHGSSPKPAQADRSSSPKASDQALSATDPDFSSGDAEKDRTDGDDEETVQCDNCSSVVKASASECPACGADLDAGWFP